MLHMSLYGYANTVGSLHVGYSLLPHDTSKLCPSLIIIVDTLFLNHVVEFQCHVNPPPFFYRKDGFALTV